MATNQFYPFATGGGANVLSNATYQALAALASGFQSGVAPSNQLNSVWRQSSFVAAAVAQLIADATGQNVNDDGVLLNFEKQLALMMGLVNYGVDTGAANAYAVTYTPAVTTLTDGMILRFKAANANTGASTFSPNGTTAKPIWANDHAALGGGEIIVNGDVWVQWNSSINGGSGAWLLIDSTGGYLKGPTPAAGDSSNKYATTAFTTGRLAGIQTFSASGTYTRSTGVKSVVVEIIGGGGGGAGVPTSGAGTITVGGGGGAGGYARKRIASPGATETVTIGAAGTGGAAGSNAGGNGGTTSFGAWCSATGGSGGATMGGAANPYVAAGGAGGSGSGGDVNAQGQSGGVGFGTNPLAIGGTGAASQFGGGGAGGNVVALASAAGATASTGAGAGGGGGATEGGSTQTTGGSGSAGLCIVYEYY